MSGWRQFVDGLGYTPYQIDLMDMARNGEEVAVMGRDYLAEALAAEEHRQGAAYGDDADHCGECKREALKRRQAECEHESYVELLTLCNRLGEHAPRLCNACGVRMLEGVE